MIIAIPLSRGRLANHFTKAQQIGFYDEGGKELTLVANPALGGSCQDKKAMRDVILAQGTTLVIVKQIGERMLGKLLDAGLMVSRGDSEQSLDCLIGLAQLNSHRLTANDGRPSLQHENKGGCCGSSHEGGSSCCGSAEGGKEASHDHKGCGANGSCCSGKRQLAKRAVAAESTPQINKATFSGFSKLD